MIPEQKYADYLEELFKDKFGTDNVTREVYTSSGRFCDFLIETERSRYAVEVENTSDEVITSGVAQAQLYAEELDAEPVVVFPPGIDNLHEKLSLSHTVHLIAIPVPTY